MFFCLSNKVRANQIPVNPIEIVNQLEFRLDASIGSLIWVDEIIVSNIMVENKRNNGLRFSS